MRRILAECYFPVAVRPNAHFLLCEYADARAKATADGKIRVRNPVTGIRFLHPARDIKKVSVSTAQHRDLQKLKECLLSEKKKRLPERYFWARYAAAFAEHPSQRSLTPSGHDCLPCRDSDRGRFLEAGLLVASRRSPGRFGIASLKQALRDLRWHWSTNSFRYPSDELRDAIDGFYRAPSAFLHTSELFAWDHSYLPRSAGKAMRELTVVYALAARFHGAWARGEADWQAPASKAEFVCDIAACFLEGRTDELVQIKTGALKWHLRFVCPEYPSAATLGQWLRRDKRFERCANGYWRLRERAARQIVESMPPAPAKMAGGLPSPEELPEDA